MKVELLYFEGCPHTEPARGLLRRVVERLAPSASIDQVTVKSEAHARELDFVGSPTIRVDGRDLEGEIRRAPAMACRLYDGAGCPPEWLVEATVVRALAPQHVLFLCVANSARSQMAEGLARAIAPQGVTVSSAGSEPTAVRPAAIQVLAELGIDISSHSSKGIRDIDVDSVEAVVTLCADEVCPAFPRPVARLHWPLADPAAAPDTTQDRLEAFRAVRDELQRRIGRLL